MIEWGILRRGLACSLLLAGTTLAGPLALAAEAATRPAVKASKPKPKISVDADGATERLRAGGLTAFAPSLLESTRFSFTAPGRSAASARVQSVERAFRFTPSGNPEGRKALSIGVSTRALTPAADTSRAAAPVETAALPSAYNVDLAVGWRGFAVNGGYTRADPGIGAAAFGGGAPLAAFAGRREAVDVGLSYRGKGWKTSLQVAAEQGSPLFLSPLERRYSVEFGGAYALNRRLSVAGGVRYQTSPVAPGILDEPREDGSVYLGTNIAF